jgi:hypothetical protein
MWSAVQGVYALVAWTIATRAVTTTASLLGALEPTLISRVRQLVRSGNGAAAVSLVERAGHPALLSIAQATADGEEPLDRVDAVVLDYGPPTRALRGMATIGTSLGLLAAIATILGSVSSTSRGAAAAFERALMGFVTAIPLWTAATIAGQQMRRVRKSLERIGLAFSGEELDQRSGDEAASEREQQTPKDDGARSDDGSEPDGD